MKKKKIKTGSEITRAIPVRIHKETIALADMLGLNASNVMREALENAVAQKTCPTCGHTVRLGHGRRLQSIQIKAK